MRETLQTRLINTRKAAGLTQGQVAEKAGITQPTYSDLENKVKTGSKHIAKIAHVLGVRALWLDTGKGPQVDVGSLLHTPDGATQEDEIEIIRTYRVLMNLSPAQRGMILDLAAELAPGDE